MKNKYSLWITPPEKTCVPVQKIITELSQRLQSPDFEPHITLIGEFNAEETEVVNKVEHLANQIKKFDITFSEVSFSTTYFQSVFLRVRSTAALMDANLKAKKIFDIQNNVFMPHMSLTYGNQDMAEREKIASQVVIPADINFTFEKMTIVLTSGNPQEWKHIAEVKVD